MKRIVPENASLIPEQATRVFQGVIFDVYQWPQEMFDGTTETFEMLKRVDTLKVLAIVDGKLVVLKEKQPKFGSFIDIPGGRHDHAEESNLSAAQREMLEETGMAFSDWRLIDVTQPFAKAEWFSYLYLATSPKRQAQPKLDAGEKIEVQLMDYEEYRDLGKSGNLRWWPNILDNINSLEALQQLPEYKGREVEV